jgi:aminopeptidase N
MRLLLLASLFALAACRSGEAPPPQASARTVAPVLTGADAVDVHSYAKPLEARVTHVALDLNVDFATKRVGGTATLDLQAKSGVNSITLDDKGLQIAAITSQDGKPLPYKVGAVDPILGAPLTVQMGPVRRIIVRYTSAPEAGALQWLTSGTDAGKKSPIC